MNFAWDLKPGRRARRFIHICDSDGKTLRHGPFDQQLFSEPEKAKQVLDYVAIQADDLKSANSIAIGFFDQKRKSSIISNGTQAKRARLTVWQNQAKLQEH